MTIISHDEPRLAEALNSAEDAFWADVITKYPEATSGDLSPHEAFNLSAAMRNALVEWLQFNCDVPPEPPKTVEIMLHRIEYYYRDHPTVLMTSSDEEHVAYCISQQGSSSGELCTLLGDNETEVFGWWEINNNPE